MPKLRVLTLVGTRPEIIKLSRIIAELDRTTDHVLVHSGQNYSPELAQRLFDDLQLRTPDYWLDAASESPVGMIAQALMRFDDTLTKVGPDAVLFYGDTDTGLAMIAAKRRKIPIFHMEAGNRCYDDRVPEEINRRVLDHLSDINMPLSEHARRCLLGEGIPSQRIIKTGSTMKEVVGHYGPKIEASTILKRLTLHPDRYILVSAHRAENVDSTANLSTLVQTLSVIAAAYDLPVIVSTHPRTRSRLDALSRERSLALDAHLTFHPPFDFTDYAKLQMHAFCVLSDSGSLTEEAAILDFPAIALRRQHERLEGMDEGTVVMAGLRHERVAQAIDLVRSQRLEGQRTVRMVDDYDRDNVSRQVVRVILSYTDYVNRTVWSRDV